MEYPVILLTKIMPQGVRFLISNSTEAYRIEQLGGEELFTKLILSELKDTDVFFDIGANVGLVTVHSAFLARTVFSFEPDSEFREHLTVNIGLNNLENVTVIPWAVSDRQGEVNFFTDGIAGKSPSMREIGERSKTVVPTDTIDTALARGELLYPNVIKIDIEGAELLALKGMKNLLASPLAPRKIFLELHPDFLPDFSASAQEVVDYLHRLDYEIISESGRDNQIHVIFQKKTALATHPSLRINQVDNHDKGEENFVTTSKDKIFHSAIKDNNNSQIPTKNTITTLTKIIPNGVRFLISNSTEAYRIEQLGGEELFTKLILSELKKTDIFFDIGANVGLVTVHSAFFAQTVYGFEPDAEFREHLSVNTNLNSLTNVTIIPWAVSDRQGEVDFFTDGIAGKSPSMREIGERSKTVVRTDSIDAALARGELLYPNVIKIDIEGAELLALKGMKNLLASTLAPRKIFLELHPDFLPDFSASAQEVVDFLHRLDYEIISESGRDNQIHVIFQKSRTSKFIVHDHTRPNENSTCTHSILIDTTDGCNLRCAFCSRNNKAITMMSTSDFENVLDKIGSDISSLQLCCAWEYSIAPNVHEIVASLGRRHIRNTTIYTNGQILPKTLAKTIIDANISTLVFSLGEAQKTTYERLRKGGNFDKLLKNIRTMADIKSYLGVDHPKLCANLTVTKSNIEELPDFISLAHYLGLSEVRGRHLILNEGLEMDNEIIDDFEYANSILVRANKIADSCSIAFDVPRYQSDRPHKECRAPWHQLYISSNGDVSVCPRIHKYEVIGNLINQDLNSVLNSVAAHKIRQQMTDGTFSNPVCEICLQNKETVEYINQGF